MNRSKSSIMMCLMASLLFGGCASFTPSCCERNTCENLRVVETAIASGYAACCKKDGDARVECLSAVGEDVQSLLGLILAAQIACQNEEDAVARDIIRDLKDTLKTLTGRPAIQVISKVGERVENSVVLFGRNDWMSLSATLLPETGEASPDTIESCEFHFASATPLRIRFGQDIAGTIDGTVSLARLEASGETQKGRPTGVDVRVRMLGQTVTLTLDKSSPFNSLETNQQGVGALSLALTVDSESSGLASSVYMGETYYFCIPVTVAADFSSVRFELTSAMAGNLYTPSSEASLNAADESSSVAIGGDPCADLDSNGIRDGADEVIRAIEQASGYGAPSQH